MLNIISRAGVVVTIISLGLALSACGYNTIPTLEEQAKARWSDVQNQYQRRTDLIPNLVATVQATPHRKKACSQPSKCQLVTTPDVIVAVGLKTRPEISKRHSSSNRCGDKRWLAHSQFRANSLSLAPRSCCSSVLLIS